MTIRTPLHFFYNFVMKIDVNYSFREPGLKLQSSLLKVKLCADLQTTKLVAQSSQSRPRNNLSFCSDDCSYQSQLRTIICALHLPSPSEAFLTLNTFSVRGGARAVQLPAHHRLVHPDRGHAPLLPPLHHQGGPGVREGRHLQAGQVVVGGSQGTRCLLCHSVSGYL